MRSRHFIAAENAHAHYILPVSSMVDAVEATRRARCSPGLPKTLPTDVASPCVHCFREAGSCVSVLHAYFSCTCMIHRLGSFSGSPSFRARMTFDPALRFALFFRAGSKVIRVLIARKEGEPGNEANIAEGSAL